MRPLDEPDCPFCQARSTMIEHLPHGWRFCNGCSFRYLLDEDGKPVKCSPTNHSPRGVGVKDARA